MIYSSGFISYLPANASPKTDYYTTIQNNEEIKFLDVSEGGVQRYLNSLFIENASNFTIYIQPIPSNYVLMIPAAEARSYDFTKVTGIKVLNNAGTKLRWSGCFY